MINEMRIVYAATHLHGEEPPEQVLFAGGKYYSFDREKIVFRAHRLTFNPAFDGFPMFTPDRDKLVFCSYRYAQKEGETNVFICDFMD